MPHDKIIEYYKKSSISVVCSKWQEPFGRTAMESASCGCATITSNKGGLSETFNNSLILNVLNENKLEQLIRKIINKPKLLKKIQRENFSNVLHKIQKLTWKTLDLK